MVCDIAAERLADVVAAVEKLGRKAIARTVDVADREQMRGFAESVHEQIPSVDILVNNAGVGVTASFVETPLEDWDWIVGINLMGVVHGCHFFVPKMIAAGRGGHVVNIASMASYVAGGNMIAYNATKFAVRGMSEALRAELALHDIGVTAICPGIINTAIVRDTRMRGRADTQENRQRAVDLFARRNYTPERVARGILRAIEKNQAVAPITLEARIAWVLKRAFPGFVRWVSGRKAARAERDASRAA